MQQFDSMLKKIKVWMFAPEYSRTKTKNTDSKIIYELNNYDILVIVNHVTFISIIKRSNIFILFVWKRISFT